MIRYIIIVLMLIGCASNKDRCKQIPWWKDQPNTYFKQGQKSDKGKYTSHKKSERRKHKCR